MIRRSIKIDRYRAILNKRRNEQLGKSVHCVNLMISKSAFPQFILMQLAGQSPQVRQRNPKVRKLVDLTRKFFAIACNHEEPFGFTIKEVCDKLAIESRRLYDLINVLEALGIIIKQQGPHYEFIGLAFVDQAVQAFVSRAASSSSTSLNANTRFKLHELSIWFMSHIIKAAPGNVSLASIESTLGLKSSQVRRLYDITNILEGMHLITIINQRGSKPSYSWNNESLSTVCRGIITKADQMGLGTSLSEILQRCTCV